MKSVIDRMHHNALMHSQRAERLMKQSIELFREKGHGLSSGSDTIKKVVELKRKAIEESQRSMRTMDFLRKYKAPQAQEERI